MSRSGPLVFVGGITLDVIAAVRSFPAADQRVLADAVVRAGGGPAATAAVAAARLGAPDVQLVGAVGDDGAAEEVLAELSAEGVDVSGVVRVAGASTGTGVIVVDTQAGTRAICARPGPELTGQPIDAERLASARLVHVDHLGWSIGHDLLRGAADVMLSADVSYPVPGFTLAGLGLFAPSLASLQERYPEARGEQALLDVALAEGAQRVVATRGAHGCVAADAEGARWDVPGVSVEVVSTLGAGDVFHGALVAALDRGDDLTAALPFANRVAALSCRGLDGRSAIPSGADLQRSSSTT
ncbi:MAG: carbohydrate kinase family protein [Jatrophihabitans sp.]